MATKASKKSGSKKSGSKKTSAKKPSSTRKTATKKKRTARKASRKATRSTTKKRTAAKRVVAATAAGAAAGAIAGRLAARARVKGFAPAACTLTNRGMCATLVLNFLAGIGLPNAVESTALGAVTTAAQRASWAAQLGGIVSARGCNPAGFTSADTRDAKNPGEIITKLWGVLRA